ncbi:hypothetical protein FGO68_gene14390 [Halteria grandinella]|uniref:Uncharacterized protein n=1 Tax=Halteria grandinella TaxID=5974 RepID=A0A8J8NBQ7_HALGN|nr:hypothetical protein FGO68_gene14390 [Halteria grandinella]
MPRSKHAIAWVNAQRNMCLEELYSLVPSTNRGLINETAVRLAASATAIQTDIASLSIADRKQAILMAKQFVNHLGISTNAVIPSLSDIELNESIEIGHRLLQITSHRGEPIRYYASIPGAGLIDNCIADGLSDSSVVEIKSGLRPFRSEDIRQGLVYAALIQLCRSGSNAKTLCLINPRQGCISEVSFDQVVMRAGGLGWLEFMQRFEIYVTNPTSFLPQGPIILLQQMKSICISSILHAPQINGIQKETRMQNTQFADKRTFDAKVDVTTIYF